MKTNILQRPFKYSYRNATLIIIGINILIYVLSSINRNIFVYLSMIPIAVARLGWVWQLFTYMFVHGNLSHLIFNMLGLLIFGTAVERSFGTKEFLLFYLLTGFLAGIASFAIYAIGSMWTVNLVGASGAIYALILAYAVINPQARVFIWGIIPVSAPVLVLIYTVVSLWFGIFGNGGNVAHLTHLAGLGFATAYFPIRFGVNPIKRLINRQ